LTLRLWGLGSVGLHGDEETMAMPALEILRSGLPMQPSGLLYFRGLGQLYMMALSVWTFGESEWAMRLPSAIAGTLGIVAAFFLGRRFLTPRWNLLFVCIIALLPVMIMMSKTARMYIFLSTALMFYAVTIFRLENDDSWKNWAAAFLVFLIAMQFHQLAIFSVFLFFLPYLFRPSGKRLFQGTLGFGLGGLIFLIFRNWVQSQYGQSFASATATLDSTMSPFEYLMIHHAWVMLSLLLLSLVVAARNFYIHRSKEVITLWANGLLVASILAIFFLQYFASFLLFSTGFILYRRAGGKLGPLAILIASLCLLVGIQFAFLSHSGLFVETKQLIKSLAGYPSPRIFVTFFKENLISTALYVIIMAYMMVNFVRGKKISGHAIFFIVSFFVPLLGMGFFAKTYVPERYISQLFAFFVLCFISGTYYVWETSFSAKLKGFSGRYTPIFSLLILLLFAQPQPFVSAVQPSYQHFPDHKGAATFAKSVHADHSALILAEDVLQMTYYLGKVDYWLRALDDAMYFAKEENGRLFDVWTHTPLIGTGRDLERLIEDNNGRGIYIISSGENADDRSHFLGNGILDVINRYRPETAYIGRDNKTVVWYFPASESSNTPLIHKPRLPQMIHE
jgi:hypothetical protein